MIIDIKDTSNHLIENHFLTMPIRNIEEKLEIAKNRLLKLDREESLIEESTTPESTTTEESRKIVVFT